MTAAAAVDSSAQTPAFESIVRMEGVQKFFGAVQALRDIDIGGTRSSASSATTAPASRR